MGRQNNKLFENIEKYEDDIDRAKCDTEAESLSDLNVSVNVNGQRYKVI